MPSFIPPKWLGNGPTHSMNAIIYFLDYLFSVVGVLLGVAFFTLIERKVIGLMHYRKGPNKVLIWGLTQPISDALKLLTKEFPKFASYKIVIFYSGPRIRIILILICWGWFNFSFAVRSNIIKIIVILAIIRLTAYGFLLTRWGSNSKYALLGGHRAVAQIISYEVCLILFLLVVVYLNKTFSIEEIKTIQDNLWFIVFSAPLFLSWVLLCMAEANRTPFDLAEGESEIVSGFNIEYGGGLFAFIFIREYGIIIFLRFLTTLFFIGATNLLVKTFLMCALFVWVRCAYPRVRYDVLIMTAWKIALPYRLGIILISTCLVFKI